MIHYRDGFHFHEISDWQVLIDVMRHLREGTPLPQGINEPPFEIERV